MVLGPDAPLSRRAETGGSARGARGGGLNARLNRSSNSLGGLSAVAAAVAGAGDAPSAAVAAAAAAAEAEAEAEAEAGARAGAKGGGAGVDGDGDGDGDEDALGDSPLHRVIRAGDERGAEALLSAGALQSSAVNARNRRGATPLMLASFLGQERVVRLLLWFGARVDLASDAGYTPFHFGVVGDRPRELELLCAQPGSQIGMSIRDRSGGTPLDFALFHRRAACEAVLRAGGAAF